MTRTINESSPVHETDAIADAVEAADEPDTTAEAGEGDQPTTKRRAHHRISWTRVLAYGVLPGLVLLLSLGAGYAKWLDSSVRDGQPARIESVRAATDTTIAVLSYRPDTVDKDLTTARARLTGQFKDDYTSLTHDVVIPGAKEKRISSVATVPAAASVSANENHAVALIFVDQTTTIGDDPPSNTASSVRVTLDKVNGRWLVSRFDPV